MTPSDICGAARVDPLAEHLHRGVAVTLPVQIGAIRLGTLGLVRAEPGELERGAVADALIVADIAALTLVDLPAGASDNRPCCGRRYPGGTGPRFTRRPVW